MLDSRNRLLIKTLVTLIADCGQIKQRTLLFDFNALESKIQINGVNILPWKWFHTALYFKQNGLLTQHHGILQHLANL